MVILLFSQTKDTTCCDKSTCEIAVQGENSNSTESHKVSVGRLLPESLSVFFVVCLSDSNICLHKNITWRETNVEIKWQNII